MVGRFGLSLCVHIMGTDGMDRLLCTVKPLGVRNSERVLSSYPDNRDGFWGLEIKGMTVIHMHRISHLRCGNHQLVSFSQ